MIKYRDSRVIIDAIDPIKDAHKEVIKYPALEALTQSSMKLGEAMYKEQQAAAGATAPDQDSEQPKDENVVDADFEEVNEDTKQA